MKVHIDAEVCQGHGRCASLAGQLFTLDDEGHGVVIRDEVTTPEDEDAADVAVRNCPERAITVDR